MRESPLPDDVVERLASVRVGVAGLGGMGSHVATALVRSGIVHMTVVDFDIVDGTNLFRQCYLPRDVGFSKADAICDALIEIEPDVDLRIEECCLGPNNTCSVFSGCDIVCECLDWAEAKAMLVETLLTGSNCVVVSCSGMAGSGSSNDIVTMHPMRRLYVCGDGISDSEESFGLTAARVMVCAGHMANMVLRIALGHDKP